MRDQQMKNGTRPAGLEQQPVTCLSRRLLKPARRFWSGPVQDLAVDPLASQRLTRAPRLVSSLCP